MQVIVKYKGETIKSGTVPTSFKLNTAGKYCEDDLSVEIFEPWQRFFASIDAGTYATDYSVGDYVGDIDLGTEGIIRMQIVAFDTDDKSDNSGKAPVTMIGEKLLVTEKRMNPVLAGSYGNYTVGTGMIGGWEHTELRTYLSGTIKPLIPADIRSRICEVTKYSRGLNSDGSNDFNMITTDEVWIPSYHEIYGDAYPTMETLGPVYNGVFNSKATRKKSTAGGSTAIAWWLRTAYSTSPGFLVSSSGEYSADDTQKTHSIALGFCLA